MNRRAKAKPAGVTERSHAIIAGACRAFLAHGYDGTRMDLVAADAGVTRKTVYNHFLSKEALFEAVAAYFCDEVAADLDLDGSRDEDVKTGLIRFCHHLIGTLAVPPGLDVYRLAIAQSRRFPAFGRALIQIGTSRIEAALAAYIECRATRGELYVEDAAAAARHLLGNLMIVTHRALLGEEILPHSPCSDRFVADVVAMFCRVYAPRPKGANA